MDRRETCVQPDEEYQTVYSGAPVYDTLEPGQASSNPIYERFVCFMALRFFASSPAIPLWYINLPLFTSTINIEYSVKNKTVLV